MGDKDGARIQLDLVLSGKHLEVNAAGRKVRWTEFFFVFLQPHVSAGQIQFGGMTCLKGFGQLLTNQSFFF